MVSTDKTLERLPITELEQSAFCQSESELRTKTLAEEFTAGVRWQRIPARYMRLSPEQIERDIRAARSELGSKVLILGHHYQREDVIKYADMRGDSYLLSKYAVQSEAEHILFCGVRFMAETADILTSECQKVILPNLAAGCSMADMAQSEDVDIAWQTLQDLLPNGKAGELEVIPVAYMNSTAEIKALCGLNNGVICTSSNVDSAFRWAFKRGKRVLFLPDQHLGRNTALKMGIDPDKMVIWNPFKELGGNTLEQLQDAQIILWQGHCSVHTRFTVKQIEELRSTHPDIKIIVHPECVNEVVNAADLCGSTEFIRKTVEEAPAGTKWGIGTEINMVKHLATDNSDKMVVCLDKRICPCATMYRVHPAYVLWMLEGILAEVEINRIIVPDDIKAPAKVALERMLELSK